MTAREHTVITGLSVAAGRVRRRHAVAWNCLLASWRAVPADRCGGCLRKLKQPARGVDVERAGCAARSTPDVVDRNRDGFVVTRHGFGRKCGGNSSGAIRSTDLPSPWAMLRTGTHHLQPAHHRPVSEILRLILREPSASNSSSDTQLAILVPSLGLGESISAKDSTTPACRSSTALAKSLPVGRAEKSSPSPVHRSRKGPMHALLAQSAIAVVCRTPQTRPRPKVRPVSQKVYSCFFFGPS